MAAAILSGQLVDVILALVVVEALGLELFRRATGRGPVPLMVGPNLLSGFCLLFALRSALVGSGWIWVAASLTAALLAHLLDLALRWPR